MSKKFRLIGVWLLAFLAAAMVPTLVAAHGGGGGGGGGHGMGGGGGGWGGGGHSMGGGYGGHSMGGYGGAVPRLRQRLQPRPDQCRAYAHSYSHAPGNYRAYSHAYHGYNWNHGGQWWQHGYAGHWNYYHHPWAYNWYPWFGFNWWPNFYAYYPYYYNYGSPDLCYGDVVAEYRRFPHRRLRGRRRTDRRAPSPRSTRERAAPRPAAKPPRPTPWAISSSRKPATRSSKETIRTPCGSPGTRPSNAAELRGSQPADAGDVRLGRLSRRATMEAHAASSLGQPINWDTLYGFYGNAKRTPTSSARWKSTPRRTSRTPGRCSCSGISTS